MPNEKHPFERMSILFHPPVGLPNLSRIILSCTDRRASRKMVEMPGTAPGSITSIMNAVYRHSGCDPHLWHIG